MLLTLLLTLKLFLLACSAEHLASFDDVTSEFQDPHVNFDIPGVVSCVIDPFTDIANNEKSAQKDSLILSFCASTCLSMPYYCLSFVALYLPSNKGKCIFMDKYVSETTFATLGEEDKKGEFIGAYQIKPENFKENGAEVLSHETTGLEGRDPSKILHEYGLLVTDEARNTLEHFIRICKIATRAKSSEISNFFEWADIRISDLTNLSQEFTGLDNEHWKSHAIKSGSKRIKVAVPPVNFPDNDILEFLDIFSRSVNPHISTVYDPIRKILFIYGNNFQILVMLFGPGDFVVAFDLPSTVDTQARSTILFTTDDKKPDRISDISKLFDAVKRTLGDGSHWSVDARFTISNFVDDNKKTYVVAVVGLLLAEPDKWNRKQTFSTLFIRDLTKATLSLNHKNQILSRTRHIMYSEKLRGNFRDSMVDIITHL